MAEKKLSGAGLRGQSAGETALRTVGKTSSGLTCRCSAFFYQGSASMCSARCEACSDGLVS